ncbi:MAG TPA: S41 family peptidase [Chitinophagaceae bacterium]|nr:S41 family peptidase [Chitinophagaceae bacterium]
MTVQCKIIPGDNLFKFPLFLLIAVFFFSCSASLNMEDFSPYHKIAPAGLKEDAVLLKKILDADHPSLYWYTPKDSIDEYFNETINGIHDSLTEMQFRSKLSWAVAKIRCGHTSVRSSKEYVQYFNTHRMVQFPLDIKVWGDSMVVIYNYIKRDTVFKRGTVITSVNGMPAGMMIDSMFQFISTDGYADNFKDQLLSIYFPLFYNLSFGLRDSNVITYIDKQGLEKTGVLYNYRPVRDTSKNQQLNIAIPKLTRRQIRAAKKRNGNNLSFDSANTARLQLVTFSGGGLRRLFKKSFEQIQDKHVTNLIIDLRANSGGNIGACANLTKYLIQQPFTIADSVSSVTHRLKYGRYIHPALIYKILMFVSAKKKKDGRYHFGYLEHHTFYPKKSLHFNGNIYIIQGGFTFSAASMFVSHLKGQRNVTVIGEETGGGNYGNSSVHLPSVILPNSHVQVVLPVYRIVNDAKRQKDGKGITPDIYVPPSSEAIRLGIDPKMQKVEELIKERKKI